VGVANNFTTPKAPQKYVWAHQQIPIRFGDTGDVQLLNTPRDLRYKYRAAVRGLMLMLQLFWPILY